MYHEIISVQQRGYRPSAKQWDLGRWPKHCVPPGPTSIRRPQKPLVRSNRQLLIWSQQADQRTIPGSLRLRFPFDVMRLSFFESASCVLCRCSLRSSLSLLVFLVQMSFFLCWPSWTEKGSCLEAIFFTYGLFRGAMLQHATAWSGFTSFDLRLFIVSIIIFPPKHAGTVMLLKQHNVSCHLRRRRKTWMLRLCVAFKQTMLMVMRLGLGPFLPPSWRTMEDIMTCEFSADTCP